MKLVNGQLESDLHGQEAVDAILEHGLLRPCEEDGMWVVLTLAFYGVDRRVFQNELTAKAFVNAYIDRSRVLERRMIYGE